MRRWPTDDGLHWHELYQRKKGVIFGHDALRGLVQRRRKERTWLVGLDSGCVYGGKLSGLLVEKDRIHQVDAKKAYRPV